MAKKQNIDKQLDQVARKGNSRLLVFVKIPKKNRLVSVYNEKWPDEVEYTYNVFKDVSGKILCISSSPYSESADWEVFYVHYFDVSGKIIAFEKRTSWFNSICADIAMETITHYYDNDLKEIGNSHKFTDSKGKKLMKSKCVFNYDFTDYKIYRNINDCLKAYNIKL